MHLTRIVFAALVLLIIIASGASCEKKASTSATTGSGAGSGSAGTTVVRPAPAIDLDSEDILARTTTAERTLVKHVLIGWKDLAEVYQGQIDPRAGARSNADAAKLAEDVASQLRANPDAIDALVKQHSEDPGSLSGDPYEVTAAAQFVPEFKAMGLRLHEKEVGIVRTQFGYHVMERVLPPPPDPVESAAILARAAKASSVMVQHVLVSWKDVPAAKQRPLDPRAKNRTKAEADALAREVLAKVVAGGDMAALMKQYSEDSGSKDSARAYECTVDAPLVESFKNLSLRLDMGEAGIVKSPFGWHVIKRVPPPPPDTLESAKILARPPVTTKAKVKHILLGWKEVHADDPRGIARERKDLEALVKQTVAKLAKGAIEPLMAELSEDPGSAKSGDSYDVSPTAQLVEPFKNLSLRLNVGEVGVVKTDFGIHIIKRVE